MYSLFIYEIYPKIVGIYFIGFIIKILAYKATNLHMYSGLVPFRTMTIISPHLANNMP